MNLFEKTFSIILTDNGTEFGNPLSLEFNPVGKETLKKLNIVKISTNEIQLNKKLLKKN